MSHTQMRYHPKLGSIYMSNAKLRAPGPNGGYLVRTNAAGFRSDIEFQKKRTPGSCRALLFGDSQTAGDGCSNAQRFSDILEKLTPGLEIYNYGISGSSPDQQLLAYQGYADVEHDLLILALNVENIRRVSRRIILSTDVDGNEVYCAKPYFELHHGELILHNVPVPKDIWTDQSLPPEQRAHVYSFKETNLFSRDDKTRLRIAGAFGPLRNPIKKIAMSIAKYQPLPDYDTPDKPEWVLLRKILETWVQTSPAPVLLVLLPHYAHLLGSSDPTNYQMRFREFADLTGCCLYDPLPEFLKRSIGERREYWSDSYGHFSARGHEAIANFLSPVILRLMSEAPLRGPTKPRGQSI